MGAGRGAADIVSDNQSIGANSSQRYPKGSDVNAQASKTMGNFKTGGMMTGSGAMNSMEEDPYTKKRGNFHETLDVKDDEIVSNNPDNVSQGGTRYVIGLKPGQALKFYG